MVLFAVPIVTSIFTGVIGGLTVHLARRNNRQQVNQQGSQALNQTQNQNERISKQKKRRKSQRIAELQLPFLQNGVGSKDSQKNQDGEQQQEIKKEQEQILNGQDSQLYKCPLTHKLLNQPVQLLCSHYFQKQPLVEYIKKQKKCPVCERRARMSQIYESRDFKNALDEFKAKKRARKWSRDRLIEDFGSDKLQFQELINSKRQNRYRKFSRSNIEVEQRAHSDTECNTEKEIKQENQINNL